MNLKETFEKLLPHYKSKKSMARDLGISTHLVYLVLGGVYKHEEYLEKQISERLKNASGLLRDEVCPRHPDGRFRMWNSMRILRAFTIGDLISTAEVTMKQARLFAGQLSRSGYLQVSLSSEGFMKDAFRLLRNSGAKTPLVRSKMSNVFDPNTGLIHPLQRAGRWEKRNG